MHKIAGAILMAVAVVGSEQPRAAGQSAARQSAAPEDQIVTTRHQVTVDGKILRYTARAGRLPILDNETGEVHGRMSFIAYALEGGPNRPARPLTFLWNGGPGSSSSLVHLLGFGPRRVRTGASPVDNHGTWLESSDLVFVDPIGTGYSRPTKAEYGPEFYQTQGDAESVAEFIRVYRNRFEAWDSPVFLAGESYGVTRAAGVADVLERRGIGVRGVVLIGLALPLGELTPQLRTALMVPTYTAAAFANRKLAPDLQKDLHVALAQSEAWASTQYAEALVSVAALGDAQRRDILAQLSRFTGLATERLDPKTLTIGMPQFAEQLLREERKVVGRYDSRMTGPLDTTQQPYDPTKDPSLEHIIDDVAVVRYLRSELGFMSDLPYQGPFGGGYPPPTAFRGDWMSVRWNRGPAGGRAAGPSRETPAAPGGSTGRGATGGTPDQPLRRAMAANPGLQVFVACGYYDLVCSYAGNAHVASHLEPDLKRRVTAKSYAGGHAIYTDAAAQLEMKRDVSAFFRRVLDVPAAGH